MLFEYNLLLIIQRINYLGWGREDSYSAIDHLQFCGFCSEWFPLPLGAKENYIILLWHSLCLPYNNFAPRRMKDECITVDGNNEINVNCDVGKDRTCQKQYASV